ncbi:hypothetical protein [Micromonospora sp. NPDC092111]|uniref:hypothetical protein n=1 Tax=Micromonospora sp. NPDC092111 TaxID=3364289 RepID=UPI003813E8E3
MESLAMLLRPGNAGSNTVADHIRVLGEALAQVPLHYRHKILIRVDGAGATHELLEHLQQMNTAWRTVRFTVGWTITDTDEAAIADLPAAAWSDSLDQDGAATATAQVAELTGLNTRAERWIDGLRLLVRRTKPSRRHRNRLTAFERRTGWRYARGRRRLAVGHGTGPMGLRRLRAVPTADRRPVLGATAAAEVRRVGEVASHHHLGSAGGHLGVARASGGRELRAVRYPVRGRAGNRHRGQRATRRRQVHAR